MDVYTASVFWQFYYKGRTNKICNDIFLLSNQSYYLQWSWSWPTKFVIMNDTLPFLRWQHPFLMQVFLSLHSIIEAILLPHSIATHHHRGSVTCASIISFHNVTTITISKSKLSTRFSVYFPHCLKHAQTQVTNSSWMCNQSDPSFLALWQ